MCTTPPLHTAWSGYVLSPRPLNIYHQHPSSTFLFPLPSSLRSASRPPVTISPSGRAPSRCVGREHRVPSFTPLQHKIHVLSLAGDLLGTFAPDKDPGFGVRAVAWHPAALFLAVLGWDDKVSH